MPSFIHFPDPADEPPVESRFFHMQRNGEGDSPEMAYLWARAVLTQVQRYAAAIQKQEELEQRDRRIESVHADQFFEAWCQEHADLHFLMEAGVQMYRWASVPDPEDNSWEARRLIYKFPETARRRWIKTLRDALVHFDEAYRGDPRGAKTLDRAQRVTLDVEALSEAARTLISQTDPEPDW